MPRGRTARPLVALAWMTALATTALLAGGCGAKQEAAATLPPVSSPTASSAAALPALGPPDFPVPAQARQKTPEGVTAFTHYYVELLNRQLSSLDPAPIRDLSSIRCDDCNELVEGYNLAKGAEHHFEGGILEIHSTGTAVATESTGEISFLLRQSPLVVRDRSGQVIPSRTTPMTTFGGGLAMEWDDQRSTWLVTQFAAEPVP